jgi:hypothetical protein
MSSMPFHLHLHFLLYTRYWQHKQLHSMCIILPLPDVRIPILNMRIPIRRYVYLLCNIIRRRPLLLIKARMLDMSTRARHLSHRVIRTPNLFLLLARTRIPDTQLHHPHICSNKHNTNLRTHLSSRRRGRKMRSFSPHVNGPSKNARLCTQNT